MFSRERIGKEKILTETQVTKITYRRVFMDEGGQRSLEDTPTWAVSVFCFFFLIISFTIDGGLHKLTEVINKYTIDLYIYEAYVGTYSIMSRYLK